MATAAPAPAKVTRRADYAPPVYRVSAVDLLFQIEKGSTKVRATLVVALSAPAAAGAPLPPLVLHKGPDVVCHSATLDGVASALSDVDGGIQLQPVAANFVLVTESTIVPEKNTTLEGLYYSCVCASS